MADPAIKGSVIIGMKEYIRQQHGDAGLETMLSRLSPETYAMVGPALVNIRKVPDHHFRDYCRCMLDYHAAGDIGAMIEIMKYSAQHNINLFMKFFLRMGNPSFVAGNVPKIWGHYFSTGRVIMNEVSSNHARFEIVDGKPYGEYTCHGIMGWGIFALEASGGRQVKARHTECQFRGGNRCLFEFTWG